MLVSQECRVIELLDKGILITCFTDGFVIFRAESEGKSQIQFKCYHRHEQRALPSTLVICFHVALFWQLIWKPENVTNERSRLKAM